MLEEFFESVICQTIVITFFVLTMIILVEFINVLTHGKGNQFLNKNYHAQIIFSAIFGILPGCFGSYAISSLFTHNVVGLGALIANLIATTGDEAFFMYAMMPQKAILITVILFLLAVLVGYITYFITKKKDNHYYLTDIHQFEIHQHHQKDSFKFRLFEKNNNLRYKFLASFVFFILLSIILIAFGEDHEHHHELSNQEVHHHSLEGYLWVFMWINVFLTVLFMFVSRHFIEEHVLDHVLKKHFSKVIIWTLISLTVVFFINTQLDVNNWITDNKFSVLLIAILIGLIPESGPHIVFISLFISGTIPFGVLLANSIVQDGHGAIPLLAEKRRTFFIIKAIKVVIALLIGLLF